MRALTLIFLFLTFTGPALAQLKPLNPPPTAPIAPAAAISPKGPGQLNAQGKVQIGYDKRADYPTIKQPVSGSAAKPAETNAPNIPTAANAQNPQNLNGNILNPSQAQRKNTPPTAANFVAGATVPATSTAATTPAKPRSDGALRSDSSPAREAAALAKTAADAKATADKKQAEALGAAIAAAQKAGALPIKP